MVDQVGKTTWSFGDGMVKSFDHQGSLHVVVGSPSADIAAKEIDFSGKENPALFGWNVGNIGDPDLIGFGGRRHLQETLRGDLASMRTIRGARDETALAQRAQALQTHQACDASSTTVVSPITEFVTQTRRAISFAALGEGIADFLCQYHILHTTGSAVFVCVVVKATAAHLQCHANFIHREGVPGIGVKVRDQNMTLGDSWPKMAKVFFKMSRCLVTVYSSARTPANSLASCTALASPPLAPFGLRPTEPTPAPPTPCSFFHRVKLHVETPNSRDNCARLRPASKIRTASC